MQKNQEKYFFLRKNLRISKKSSTFAARNEKCV